MSLLRTVTLFASLSAVALLACSAETEPSADDEAGSEDALVGAQRIAPGVFALRASPGVTSPGCDVFTKLTLDNAPGARATLEERVSGVCTIVVDPDLRGYRLREVPGSCGSRAFVGSRRVGGERHTIKITDHRTRLCHDLQPGTVVVEETRAGTTTTTYGQVLTAPPPPSSQWLSYAPRQCGTNPWNGAQPAPGKVPSHLGGELAEIVDYFRGQGVELELVGLVNPAEPRIVCMACSCPRGDALVVKAKSPADAAQLKTQWQFAEAAGLTTAPVQCGGNDWEQSGTGASEQQRLVSWAASVGAPIAEAGFLSRVELSFVCQACSCPRGDVAFATPEDAAAGAKLEQLGWGRTN